MKNLLSFTAVMIITLFAWTSSAYALTATPSPANRLQRPQTREGKVENTLREPGEFDKVLNGSPSRKKEEKREGKSLLLEDDDRMEGESESEVEKDEETESRTREPSQDTKERQEQQCQLFMKRVEAFKQVREKRHESLEKKYTSMVLRLTKLEEKFAEKGYDTAELKAGIDTLSLLVDTLVEDYPKFAEGMSEVKCEEKTELAAFMTSSKMLMNVIRTDILNIKEHYQTVIRPALVALKEQSAEEEKNNEDVMEAPVVPMEKQSSPRVSPVPTSEVEF